MSDRRDCPSCGMQVELERTLESGYVLVACQICGLGLGVRPATAAEVRELNGESPDTLARVGVVKRGGLGAIVEKAPAADPRAADPRAAPEPPPERPAPPPRQMRRVFVVEDSAFLRALTRDLLLERQLAREVQDWPDGPAFIEAFARAVHAGEKPDLVILDVRMPGMDGREAAYAIRAIETVHDQKRTPILFFSGVLCDEPFKESLKELTNARYVRKSDEDVQRLGERIAEVLGRLVGAA
ncbi:MAG: response regulator [bacterium]